MPDIQWNIRNWSDADNWPDHGNGWSVRFGGAEAQWHTTIRPRIRRWLPARTILEIGPGHGKWTQFLLAECDTYHGVDVTEACTTECRRRFEGQAHASFTTNDGLSLPATPPIDLAFSFDSLVHCEMDVMTAYLVELIRVLSPTGGAFIHHSNAGTPGVHVFSDRGATVSAVAVRDAIRAAGGHVLIQEEITWGDNPILLDCLTTFRRSRSEEGESVHLKNRYFTHEANIIRVTTARYFEPD